MLTNAQPRGLAEAIALSFGELALGDAADGVLTADWLTVMQGRMRGLYQPLGQHAGQPPPEAPAPPQPLARYAGRYTNAYYGSAQVTPNADGKTLDLVLGPARVHHQLRHWSGDSFVFDLQGENAPPGSISAVRFAPDEPAHMQIEYYAEDLTHGRFDREADTPSL